MADKFNAAFHGISDEEMRAYTVALAGAVQKDQRTRRMKIIVKNLLTTIIITGWFTLCLKGGGVWGYVPAELVAAGYFIVRDLRKPM